MQFLDNEKRKIIGIIKAKQKADPEGFAAAQRSGSLFTYLQHELKSVGISTTADFNRILGTTYQQQQKEDDLLLSISDALDDNIFAPIFKENAAQSHVSFAEVLMTTKSSEVGKTLAHMKVGFALASLFSSGMCARSISQGNLPKVIIFGVFAGDCFRMSYNCYMKKYCAAVIKRFFGDAASIGKTIFASVSSAVGLADPASDPLLQVRTGVIFELIYENTTLQYLYQRAKVFVTK
jgi:hypothetical protein